MLPTHLFLRALQRDLLIQKVAEWKATEVRAVVSDRVLMKLSHAVCHRREDGDSEAEEGIRTWPTVIAAMSEAVGADLWLDGSILRGRVTSAADKRPAQAILEEQVRRDFPHAIETNSSLCVGIEC